MFIPFFLELKAAKVPVSLREYLSLLEGMEADLVTYDVEGFYYLSRAALVKDERNLDKFDRVFGHVFKGLDFMSDAVEAEIPAEWLKKLAEKFLTEEEKKQIEALGGLDKLMRRCASASRNRRSAIRAATSGSARRARRRSALTATIRKACASARTATATSAR